jgi:ribonucleoside-diphosphate reductase alpha chain
VQAQLAEAIKQQTASQDAANQSAPPRAVRHRLPSERASVTHKFGIAGHEGYVTVGLYPSGAPGEIFIRMAKEGSTISGLMDSFATAVSMCLQHGVPLKLLCEKFSHTRFEPSGWTGNPEIGYAKSIMDYLFRWMQMRFLSGQQLDLFAGMKPAVPTDLAAATHSIPVAGAVLEPDNAVVASAERDGPSAGTAVASAQTFPLSFRNEVEDSASSKDAAIDHDGSAFNDGRRAPQQGIAPDLTARAGLSETGSFSNEAMGVADRGIYHASDAMKQMYDMSDAPACHDCGALMVKNGACHRCMECGGTSGCS